MVLDGVLDRSASHGEQSNKLENSLKAHAHNIILRRLIQNIILNEKTSWEQSRII
jgi:hypothetical protein